MATHAHEAFDFGSWQAVVIQTAWLRGWRLDFCIYKSRANPWLLSEIGDRLANAIEVRI